GWVNFSLRLADWPWCLCGDTQLESRRLLASCGTTSLGAALVAINLVAVRAGIIQFLADVDEGFEVSGLGCASGRLSHVGEGGNILFPVRAIDRGKLAVLAFASGGQQERCRFNKGNGRLIDGEPSGIDCATPLDVIKRRRRRLLLRLVAGIF